MTPEATQPVFVLRLEKREGPSAGEPETRPGVLRIPQQQFVNYIRQEAGISRPSAFDRLRKLERKGLVTTNRGQGRNTIVTVDLQRFVANFADQRDGEKPGERLDGPFGLWAFSKEDEQRLVDMGVLERNEDASDSQLTKLFIDRFEDLMKNLESKFPREDLHLGAIARVLGEMAGPSGLTPKELISLLDMAQLFFSEFCWPDPTRHRDWTPDTIARMMRARLLEEKTDGSGLRYWTLAPSFREKWEAVHDQAPEGRESDLRVKLVQSLVFGLSEQEAALYHYMVTWILWHEEEKLKVQRAEDSAAGS